MMTKLKNIDSLVAGIEPTVQKIATVRNLLWLIYIALLGVLLPHTAWAFAQFQSEGSGHLAWLLAFVFEASVFAFTHNMIDRIERASRLRRRSEEPIYSYVWRRLSTAYLHVNGIGLLLVSAVSALANVTYTVEFSRLPEDYAAYSPTFYLAFGGILPVISFLFAHILAKQPEVEIEASESELRAKAEAQRAKAATQAAQAEAEQLRRQLKQAQAKAAAIESEIEIFRRLFADEKKDQIVAARQIWPDATGAAIASITDSSPSYVSDVLGNYALNGTKNSGGAR